MNSDTSTQTYRSIISNIGEHLRSRQKLILKRIGLVSAPLILTALPLIYGAEFELEGDAAIIYFGIFFILTFLAFWWGVVLGQIFKIERVIWVDSFFDKVPLDDRQSWKLAKRLFWPSVAVGVINFLRFYLVLLALYLVAVCWHLWYWQSIGGSPSIFLGVTIGGALALWAYFYFVKIRLRYINFLLVDTYGTPSFSYSKLYSDSKALNRTIKMDDFKKLFVTTIGSDVVGDITNFTVSGTIGAVSKNMGAGGKMAGAAVQQYAAEVVDVNKKLAQTVTFYLYYRVAKIALGEKEQSINVSLYGSDLTTKVE